MRLLKQLKNAPFCNNIHHFLFVLILFLLIHKSIAFIPLLFIYFVYLFLKTKLLIPILIMIALFILRLSIFYIMVNEAIPNRMNVYVIDVDTDSYTAYYKGIKLKLYEKNHQNIPGDIIDIEYKESYIKDKSYEEEFDYKEYLYSKGIIHQGISKTKNNLKNTFSINILKYKYLTYLKENLNQDSYDYVASVVFGLNQLEDNLKESYSILGISHILAISGLHILFLYSIISFILLKVFHYYGNKIQLIIIFLYCIFIGFIPSAFRAFFFLFLGKVNKHNKIKYTRLDILSITCIFFLLINPYLIYQTGFILTFLVSFVLLFTSRDEFKNKLIEKYKMYIIIYFSTFPFVISITNRISLLSFILGPIFSIFIAYILLPVSYIVSVLPVTDFIFKYVFIILNQYIDGISQYGLSIPIKSFSLFLMVLYYGIFLLFVYSILKKRKIFIHFFIFVSYLLIFIHIDYANPYYKITFIDCGQGDACLIELPNNKGKILIDAYNSYSYLKSMGIDSIDYFIITHSDNDHIGDYKEILSHFHVSNIYFPIFDDKCKTLLKDYSYKAIKKGYSIHFDNIELECLGPIHDLGSVNSNSLVLKMNLFGYSYLFGGDMEYIEEVDLIKEYGSYLKSDILKVSHHGSDTSSSKEILAHIRPSISVISVGYNNKYNFPSFDVVSRLKDYGDLYITYMCGNITIYQRENQFFIKTFKN